MAHTLARGLWIWNTASIITSPTGTSQLIIGAQQADVTDLYLYTAPESYASTKPQLQTFIASATEVGLRVWGLDGDRAYFGDAAGPSNFYHGIDNLTAYNDAVAPNERFFGFQADNEPSDQGDYTSFHNGIPDSALSTAPGSGLWQATQALDREMLMRSWLSMHTTAQQLLHAHGLQFGAAMPWWTENYEGGELSVSFPNASNERKGIMKYMMGLVDEFVIMSYNTDPALAAARVGAQAAYASTMPTASRPRVYASVEVTQGIGANISYGDTAGKDFKTVVMNDVATLTSSLMKYAAFEGIAIHQWSAWETMPT
ncbi:hypothetical protein LTR42_007221 [Elasticomyces elasticus]|nr:hypothetical protein LTR42_007221 [Elasticomyces elasticus]